MIPTASPLPSPMSSPWRRAALLFAACAATLAAGTALAQSWPAKPVRLIISFPPGGSIDVVPRIVAPVLQERMGQPWVIDNRPGAGGQIATGELLKAPADGYTLLVGSTGILSVNPHLYKKLSYDPLRDLVPITGLGRSPFVLLVPANGPATVQELVAQAKARPGALNYGHGGNGTGMHLSGELFKVIAGINITAVPFKTSATVLTTMAGGDLNAGWTDTSSARTGIRGGRVRALAVGSKERYFALPEVPTMAEAGFPAYESLGWFGIVGAAGTPPEVVSRLSAEVQRALALPEVQEKIRATGNDPWIAGPEAFGAFIRAEHAKWGPVVKASGATAD